MHPTNHDPQPNQEHPSTYVVQDRSNQAELHRLDEQDRLFTSSMGGVLPEQTDPGQFRCVLDVGCGPGGWLIETARTYPTIPSLVGVDISSLMIAFANQQAAAKGVSNRVRFQTGDALRLLDFPGYTFDLVNQRFGMSYLRKWDWPKLLPEYQRVATHTGTIRLTEASLPSSNSPALEQSMDRLQTAFFQAGHFPTDTRASVIDALAAMMSQYGIMQVQTRRYSLIYGPTNPDERKRFVADLHLIFQHAEPFLRKWARSVGDATELYQAMVRETTSSEFEASITILTAWGTKFRSDHSLAAKESV